MGLEFVNGQLFLPAFVVEHNQTLGRMPMRVQQRGQQAMLLARTRSARIVEGVVDNPHHHAAFVALAVSRRGVELGQARAVAQPAQRHQYQVLLDPGQQVRPLLPHLFDRRVAQKAAIPQ